MASPPVRGPAAGRVGPADGAAGARTTDRLSPSGQPIARSELWGRPGVRTVIDMADSAVQQQLDEVRALLHRARALFGPDPIAPPTQILPDPDAADPQVR